MTEAHLHDELARNPARVSVDTRYGPVVGGRASNEAVIFLGNLFISAARVLPVICVLIRFIMTSRNSVCVTSRTF